MKKQSHRISDNSSGRIRRKSASVSDRSEEDWICPFKTSFSHYFYAGIIVM
ncbi:MAG: hypothetical protein WBM32_03490 [Crocosphaera sp.]